MGSALALCSFLYYVQHCSMKLRTPLCICTMYSILQIAMYYASVVHSIFYVGSSTNITFFWLGLLCLLFAVGCSYCITACSYIVLPCYILYLSSSCAAGSVVVFRCYGCCALYIGARKEYRLRYNCCLLAVLAI